MVLFQIRSTHYGAHVNLPVVGQALIIQHVGGIRSACDCECGRGAQGCPPPPSVEVVVIWCFYWRGSREAVPPPIWIGGIAGLDGRRTCLNLGVTSWLKQICCRSPGLKLGDKVRGGGEGGWRKEKGRMVRVSARASGWRLVHVGCAGKETFLYSVHSGEGNQQTNIHG